jgi:hypothetical protein
LRDHEEHQMPGPPLPRQVVAVVILGIALALFMGWVPLGVVTLAAALALIGAALII